MNNFSFSIFFAIFWIAWCETFMLLAWYDGNSYLALLYGPIGIIHTLVFYWSYKKQLAKIKSTDRSLAEIFRYIQTKSNFSYIERLKNFKTHERHSIEDNKYTVYVTKSIFNIEMFGFIVTYINNNNIVIETYCPNSILNKPRKLLNICLADPNALDIASSHIKSEKIQMHNNEWYTYAT